MRMATRTSAGANQWGMPDPTKAKSSFRTASSYKREPSDDGLVVFEVGVVALKTADNGPYVHGYKYRLCRFLGPFLPSEEIRPRNNSPPTF
ncbi:hypothetical protein KCU59_g61, partial [Aureobasidium melanogenum]